MLAVPTNLHEITEANNAIADELSNFNKKLPDLTDFISYLMKQVRSVATTPEYKFTFKENEWLCIEDKKSYGNLFAIAVLPLFYGKIKSADTLHFDWDDISPNLLRLAEIIDAIQKGYIDHMMMHAYKLEEDYSLLSHEGWRSSRFSNLPRQIPSPIDSDTAVNPNMWWDYLAQLEDLLLDNNIA